MRAAVPGRPAHPGPGVLLRPPLPSGSVKPLPFLGSLPHHERVSQVLPRLRFKLTPQQQDLGFLGNSRLWSSLAQGVREMDRRQGTELDLQVRTALAPAFSLLISGQRAWAPVSLMKGRRGCSRLEHLQQQGIGKGCRVPLPGQ